MRGGFLVPLQNTQALLKASLRNLHNEKFYCKKFDVLSQSHLQSTDVWVPRPLEGLLLAKSFLAAKTSSERGPLEKVRLSARHVVESRSVYEPPSFVTKCYLWVQKILPFGSSSIQELEDMVAVCPQSEKSV